MNRSVTFRPRRFVALFLLFLFFAAPATLLSEDGLEELLERSESEGNLQQLIDDLQELRKKKISLNETDGSDLLLLPFLDASDVEKILRRRREKGPITSTWDLEALIGSEKARSAEPYILFTRRAKTQKREMKEAGGSLTSRVFWENPPRKGIETGKYAGENYKIYNRLMAGSGHFSLSAVQEKDIGEPDFNDFSAVSLRVDDVGVIRHAVLGNYKLSFGQGLLLGQGRYLPKGTDPVEGAGLFVSGIRPVTSSSEYGFMKGGASTFGYKSLELTAFYSRNRLDAAISREGMATSLSTTGFHRTLTERERKDNLLEETEGANLHYRYRASSFTATVGGTLLSYRYDRPVDWLASSRARTAESLEAAVVFNSFSMFGETAFSHDPHAVSWISGVQAHLTPDVSAVASIRHYDERYYSPFAGAFAERGDDGSNEEGYYVGIDAKLLKNLKVSTSYDIFRFPDLGSSITLPADGHDGRLYVTWEQNPSLKWSGLYQHKERQDTKIQSAEDGREYVMAVPVTSTRLQLNLESRISPCFLLKTRGEYKTVHSEFSGRKESEKGWLLFEQLNCTSGRFGFKTRFTLFDTDSYTSAVYAYEDDLPLVYSLGTYYGKGNALFVIVSYGLLENVKLAAKYETTWYSDRESVGSGNDLRQTSSPGSFHLGCVVQF